MKHLKHDKGTQLEDDFCKKSQDKMFELMLNINSIFTNMVTAKC